MLFVFEMTTYSVVQYFISVIGFCKIPGFTHKTVGFLGYTGLLELSAAITASNIAEPHVIVLKGSG